MALLAYEDPRYHGVRQRKSTTLMTACITYGSGVVRRSSHSNFLWTAYMSIAVQWSAQVHSTLLQ